MVRQGVQGGLVVFERGKVVAAFLTDNLMGILGVGVQRIGDDRDVLQRHEPAPWVGAGSIARS